VRQRKKVLLPFFLIALLAQIFAPVGVGLIMSAAADPTASWPICSQSGAVETKDHGQSPSQRHSDDECCGLCQIANAPPTILHPSLIGLIIPPALYRIVMRSHSESVAQPLFIGDHARARAPPSFS
jgi:hypothetical protein